MEADAGGGGGLGSWVGDAVSQIKAGNDALAGGVASGTMKMNPDAANKAAQVYEEKASAILDLADRADQLSRLSGLGVYLSSQQLTQKFKDKASNGSSGAADLLRKLAEEMHRKSELFKQAAKDYVATDDQNAQDIARGLRQ